MPLISARGTAMEITHPQNTFFFGLVGVGGGGGLDVLGVSDVQ